MRAVERAGGETEGALAEGDPRARLRDRPSRRRARPLREGSLAAGDHVDVRVAEGAFSATVDETRA